MELLKRNMQIIDRVCIFLKGVWYKLYVRQHTVTIQETVLYAVM